MRTIGIAPEKAENALAVLAWHVPPGVEIGRPRVARPDENGVCLVMPTAFWWVHSGYAARMEPLPDGRAEVTVWCIGHEVDRYIGNVG